LQMQRIFENVNPNNKRWITWKKKFQMTPTYLTWTTINIWTLGNRHASMEEMYKQLW
jgi:hypothetical protein